jgi:hypothetical protein
VVALDIAALCCARNPQALAVTLSKGPGDRWWTCRNAPSGTYYAAVTGNAPTAVGIRW